MRIFALLPIAAVLALAAGDKSADAVKSAEKAWAAATVAGNEAALHDLLADDLTYTHSTGETDSRTSYIANLKSGKRVYKKIEHDGMDVRLYGNAAVVT